MKEKILKNIVEKKIGKQAVPLIDLLIGKKDVNEFLIAKKLDISVNNIRNILYKLSDYNLVSFTRKKDKRKGWYIYFWTLNNYQSLDFLERTLKEDLQNLEEELKNRIEKRFFTCKNCMIEVNEETALVNDFKCNECGETYELTDNNQIIEKIKKEIEKIKKEIKEIEEEKEGEKKKLESKKIKKIEKTKEKKKIEKKEKIKKKGKKQLKKKKDTKKIKSRSRKK